MYGRIDKDSLQLYSEIHLFSSHVKYKSSQSNFLHCRHQTKLVFLGFPSNTAGLGGSSEMDTRSGSDESNSTATRITPQQHPEPQVRSKINGNSLVTDEHSLIAQYCHKLHNGDLNSIVPDSPLQLMAELDNEKRHQIELMIRYSH